MVSSWQVVEYNIKVRKVLLQPTLLAFEYYTSL